MTRHYDDGSKWTNEIEIEEEVINEPEMLSLKLYYNITIVFSNSNKSPK